MEMASNATLFEERVKEALKRCQERREPPLIWATEMVKCLDSAGLGLPSVELGQVLVSQLCFAHNCPSMWKFLDHALSSRLLSPLHVLSLLTSRFLSPSFESNNSGIFFCFMLICLHFWYRELLLPICLFKLLVHGTRRSKCW